MFTTLLHTPVLDAAARQRIGAAISGELESCGGFFRLRHPEAVDATTLAALRSDLPFDINVLSADFDPARVRLLVTDMDSTLITIECIDEIADFAGRKAEVAAVTEAAMRGEIDFPTSLRRRVAALEGLDEAVLLRVYEERLHLNPGAEAMLAGLRAHGVSVGLVSGGFTFFTERLRQRLGLDAALANTLEVKDGRLTGCVLGDIVDADGKARFLKELCERMGITSAQVIALGDGANDLKMLHAAGLGVAYHAKPKVQTQARAVLNHSGLDAVLHFLE
ncbi:MAG: phosphoserine phosphatase SerB [Thiohalomonadaceae bacterium]